MEILICTMCGSESISYETRGISVVLKCLDCGCEEYLPSRSKNSAIINNCNIEIPVRDVFKELDRKEEVKEPITYCPTCGSSDIKYEPPVNYINSCPIHDGLYKCGKCGWTSDEEEQTRVQVKSIGFNMDNYIPPGSCEVELLGDKRYWSEQSAPACPDCGSIKTFWETCGNLVCLGCKKVYEDINRYNVNLSAPKLKDSGTRREFDSGAVRDISQGKGRCDLLPLDVVALLYTNPQKPNDKYTNGIFIEIEKFKEDKQIFHLTYALEIFSHFFYDSKQSTMLLECSKHFEAGAVKYGENNWKKGIPLHCYLDSAVRHYLKHLRGDTDEPHDRAFVWNLLCAIWTFTHKPELDDVERELVSEKTYQYKDGDTNCAMCVNHHLKEGFPYCMLNKKEIGNILEANFCRDFCDIKEGE